MLYTESGWCILTSGLLSSALLGNVVLLTSQFEAITRTLPQYLATYMGGVVVTSGLAALWIAVIPAASLWRQTSSLRTQSGEHSVSPVAEHWSDPRDEVRGTATGVRGFLRRLGRGQWFRPRPLNTGRGGSPKELEDGAGPIDTTGWALPWGGREVTLDRLFHSLHGAKPAVVGVPADVALERAGV
jgi:hypothetical protein